MTPTIHPKCCGRISCALYCDPPQELDLPERPTGRVRGPAGLVNFGAPELSVRFTDENLDELFECISQEERLVYKS